MDLILPQGQSPEHLIERCKDAVIEPGMHGIAGEFNVSLGNALCFIIAGGVQMMNAHSSTKTRDFLRALADVVEAGDGLASEMARVRLNTTLRNFLSHVGGL